MGSLSRNFDSWRSYVHLQARNSGIGGQMASLIHDELTSISDHARDIASTQHRSVEVIQTGFDEMSSAVDHLAWVQERANESQLSALYQVSRLQELTNDELKKANSALVQVVCQLNEVADILQNIHNTQEIREQREVAELKLKEVLFQLTTILEEMAHPDDDIARLALSKMAISELDRHGLGTANLSSLDDKRTFDTFKKTLRKTIAGASHEVVADLTAFETFYKAYCDFRRDPPCWQSARPPEWISRQRPELHLLGSPAKPAVVASPPFPSMPPRDELPENDAGGNAYRISIIDGAGNLQVLNPDNGNPVTPRNVPTAAGTNQRFPQAMSGKAIAGTAAGAWLAAACTVAFPPAAIVAGVAAYKTYKAHAASQEAKNKARAFESALRTWSEGVANHERYLRDCADWEAAVAEVRDHNAQAEREFQETLATFEREEKERLATHERASAEHAEAERARYENWFAGFQQQLESFGDIGEVINEFLANHPDIELTYDAVPWEQDAAEIERRHRESVTPNAPPQRRRTSKKKKT